MLIFCLTFNQNATILNNLGGLFVRGLNEIIKQDSTGILSHIKGNEQQNVEQISSSKSSIDAKAVKNILKIACVLFVRFIRNKQKN